MILHGVSVEEASTIARLHARAFDHPWSAEAMTQLMQSPGVAVLVAVDHDFSILPCEAGEGDRGAVEGADIAAPSADATRSTASLDRAAHPPPPSASPPPPPQAGGDHPFVGFVMLRAVLDEAEILTLAVDPAARRIGVGAALVQAAIAAARSAGAATIWLEVAADNLAARALYDAAGFAAAGGRPGYYARPEGAVDALVLRRALNSAPV